MRGKALDWDSGAAMGICGRQRRLEDAEDLCVPGPSRIKIDRCLMENLATRTHTHKFTYKEWWHCQWCWEFTQLELNMSKLHLMLQQAASKESQHRASHCWKKQHRGPRWVLVASCLASNCALPRRPSSSGRVENVDCNSKSPPTTPWTSVTSSWENPLYLLSSARQRIQKTEWWY